MSLRARTELGCGRGPWELTSSPWGEGWKDPGEAFKGCAVEKYVGVQQVEKCSSLTVEQMKLRDAERLARGHAAGREGWSQAA